MSREFINNQEVLVLLPSVEDDNAYEWTPGIVVAEHASSFYGSGPSIEARGREWRGCNTICLLPANATLEQQEERLQQVLCKMQPKRAELTSEVM